MLPLRLQSLFERALNSPVIIPAFNPRRDRMLYFNTLKKYKLPMSVYCEEFAQRLIIGPSEFKHEVMFLDLATCSQKELDEAWKNREPLPEMEGTEFTPDEKLRKQLQERDNMQKLKEAGELALRSMGFGGTKEEQEKAREEIENKKALDRLKKDY